LLVFSPDWMHGSPREKLHFRWQEIEPLRAFGWTKNKSGFLSSIDQHDGQGFEDCFVENLQKIRVNKNLRYIRQFEFVGKSKTITSQRWHKLFDWFEFDIKEGEVIKGIYWSLCEGIGIMTLGFILGT